MPAGKKQAPQVKKIKAVLLCAALALLLPAGAALLLWNGVWQLNNPSREQYPVRGVDVARYQGEIDWPVLAGQDIDFAYIKATEGSSYTDPFFARNWQAAHETDLLAGAYHFFSFESPGSTQADHFTEQVPRQAGTLPPVVDIEFYGGFFENPADADPVIEELHALLDALEEHYGVPPVLYTTVEAFHLYIEPWWDAGQNPLWLRSVYRPVGRTGIEGWTFWQYSNRGRLRGYQGEERFIDLNLFCGSLADLQALTAP